MARDTEHFKVDEFLCKCGRADCGPGRDKGRSLISQKLLNACELIRIAWGGPIRVNSGYRCPDHNASIPGAAKNSRHLVGDAADIAPCGAVNVRAFQRLVKRMVENGSLPDVGGYKTDYPTWVHIDMRPKAAKGRAVSW